MRECESPCPPVKTCLFNAHNTNTHTLRLLKEVPFETPFPTSTGMATYGCRGRLALARQLSYEHGASGNRSSSFASAPIMSDRQGNHAFIMKVRCVVWVVVRRLNRHGENESALPATTKVRCSRYRNTTETNKSMLQHRESRERLPKHN